MTLREQDHRHDQPNPPEIRLIRDADHAPIIDMGLRPLYLSAAGRTQAFAKGLELGLRETFTPDTKFVYAPADWSIETMARVGAGLGKIANKNLESATSESALETSYCYGSSPEIISQAEWWLNSKTDTMKPGDRTIAFTAEDMIAHIVAHLQGLDDDRRSHLQKDLTPASETRLVLDDSGKWQVAEVNARIRFPKKTT